MTILTFLVFLLRYRFSYWLEIVDGFLWIIPIIHIEGSLHLNEF
jgi:hypothetical protein